MDSPYQFIGGPYDGETRSIPDYFPWRRFTITEVALPEHNGVYELDGGVMRWREWVKETEAQQ